MAEKIFDDYNEYEDGTFYEAKVFRVEVSSHYPEGIKYSFQYCTPEGENILRYDNSRHHTDIPSHHKHVGAEEEIEDVEFPGDFLQHFDDFIEEVKNHGGVIR
ncbi:MAG: DUF6516 family protein [Halobacteria archaeon]